MNADPDRPWFHCSPIAGDRVVVTGDEAHHMRGARRLKVGAPIVLFDGAGTEALGRITRIDRHEVEVAIESRAEHPRSVGGLTLAAAMPKGRRQDVLIEKLTELSVETVWPMLTARSVVRPDPDRVTKWRRTAVEAAKQSHQPFVPRIEPPAPFTDVLSKAPMFDRVLLASLSEGVVPIGYVLATPDRAARTLALVGPEGGFTAHEHDAAIRARAVGVRLGPAVLRVETAAIALAALLGAHADNRTPRASV